MEVSGVTAQDSRDQFLQLLVTQMQHQDPLDPIKQEQFLSQLAEFSTLEGIENLNSNFEAQIAVQESSLRFQELAQAATMVGREIQYTVPGENGGPPEVRRGTVSGVSQINGRIEMKVGDDSVKWDDVFAIGANDSVAGSNNVSAPSAPATSGDAENEDASDVAEATQSFVDDRPTLPGRQPDEAFVPF